MPGSASQASPAHFAMIRRDAGDEWLLISQADHARIAAEMAQAWGNEPFALLPSRELLIHAIRHHDDGWAEWERAPKVNPESGVPRDFLEMPIRDAAVIWTRSIETCARRAPWCGLWVSRHFCHLAELAREHREDQSDRAAASAFLVVQQEFQHQWRRRIGTSAEPALETAGFEWLRWFDRLSLWLCCAERHAPDTLSAPGGMSVRLLPCEPATITLDPYPFRNTKVRLVVSAVRTVQRPFASDRELRTTLSRALQSELSWTLQRP